jgi:nucleotide-binding universal stress UspA family protein
MPRTSLIAVSSSRVVVAIYAVRDTSVMAGAQRIVVGVDGSPASDAALGWACDEAALRGAGVVALHVLNVPYELPRVPVDDPQTELEREGKQVLDDALARVDVKGAAVETRLLAGSPGELLVEASEDATLVVVGTRAHGRLASFVVGSVSSTVVHHAACPVVVVRG